MTKFAVYEPDQTYDDDTVVLKLEAGPFGEPGSVELQVVDQDGHRRYFGGLFLFSPANGVQRAGDINPEIPVETNEKGQMVLRG